MLMSFNLATAQPNRAAPSPSLSRAGDAVALNIADVTLEDGAIAIQLNAQSRNDLAGFTERHVGEMIDFLVDGHVLFSAKLRTTILGGRISLPSKFEAEAASGMAWRLKTGKAKLVLRVNRLGLH
jgi:preprotein translocase subunit SecD